jgi:hypothetical protein
MIAFFIFEIFIKATFYFHEFLTYYKINNYQNRTPTQMSKFRANNINRRHNMTEELNLIENERLLNLNKNRIEHTLTQ